MNTNSEYQKKLLKKWGAILESGSTRIGSVQGKLTVAQLLENTHRDFVKHGFFTEATNTLNPTVTPQGAYDISQGVLGKGDYVLPNVVMPMLRRIFPNLIAHELVSVQPLDRPTGIAIALRITGPNGGNEDYDKNFEYGYERSVGTTGKKTTKGFPPFGSAKSKLAERFGLGDDYDRGEGRGATEGEGFSQDGTGNDVHFGRMARPGEPDKYPLAGINFIKTPVEAKTRKLGTEWSVEFAEDLEAMHGIDIETEMVNSMSAAIGAEIDQEIVDYMLEAGAQDGSFLEWDVASADGLDQMGRISTLLTLLTKAANDIAVTTRMGAGNFVVASNNVCSAIQQLGAQKLVTDGKTMPSVPASAVGALAKEGLINEGRQLLVRNTYAPVDYALIGYKGTAVGSSGIIYCPYIPITLVKTVDPWTFNNRIGVRTRYGMLNNPFDAKNFYRLIKVDLDQEYPGIGGGKKYFFGEAATFEPKAAVAKSLSLNAEHDVQPDGRGAEPDPEYPTWKATEGDADPSGSTVADTLDGGETGGAPAPKAKKAK